MSSKGGMISVGLGSWIWIRVGGIAKSIRGGKNTGNKKFMSDTSMKRWNNEAEQ